MARCACLFPAGQPRYWLGAIALLAVGVFLLFLPNAGERSGESPVQGQDRPPRTAPQSIEPASSQSASSPEPDPQQAVSPLRTETATPLRLDEAIRKSRQELAEKCPAIVNAPPQAQPAQPMTMGEAIKASEQALKDCRHVTSPASPFGLAR